MMVASKRRWNVWPEVGAIIIIEPLMRDSEKKSDRVQIDTYHMVPFVETHATNKSNTYPTM